jgi:hypothetical protein
LVERTFGWINRARRLAKDFEATIESSLAWLMLALAALLLRRLAGSFDRICREKHRPKLIGDQDHIREKRLQLCAGLFALGEEHFRAIRFRDANQAPCLKRATLSDH